MNGAESDRLRRQPPPPIPIIVLTGFLGAGKTTLLNAWVKTKAFSDVAVVINEFGEIGLDHLLVEKAEGTILTLSSGCLCCTIRGDLITTLEDLIRRRDNDRVPAFSRIVIETTGLADPAPILNTILFHPYLPLRYRIDSVVTVVDAMHADEIIRVHDEALRQVAVADTLIVTKSDLAGREGVEAAKALVRELNPGALVLDAAEGQASAEAVLRGGVFSLETRQAAVRDWLDPSRFETNGHAHHHHDVNRHDARIAATCLTRDEPLDDSAFQMLVDLVRSTYGAQLLRAKGIIALRSDPERPLVIHGVQHYFHPAHKLAAWPDEDRRSRMVFITRDLDPAVLSKLWNGFLGAPAIDTPDAAGLGASLRSDQAGSLFG